MPEPRIVPLSEVWSKAHGAAVEAITGAGINVKPAERWALRQKATRAALAVFSGVPTEPAIKSVSAHLAYPNPNAGTPTPTVRVFLRVVLANGQRFEGETAPKHTNAPVTTLMPAPETEAPRSARPSESSPAKPA